MPARSIIPHLKTLLMCGVAYVTKERIDARALAWIPLGSSSPQASACPTHVHTTTVTTVAREFQRSSKSGGEIPPADFSFLVYSCVLFFVKNVSENMPEVVGTLPQDPARNPVRTRRPYVYIPGGGANGVSRGRCSPKLSSN
ncbi:hypothetical protein AMECASPLE_031328 [Ameca splendens]|uniref:Uncharacterized protein n=1 Tax=Ameca splendens TaxID=208324 RepID=A0ABV0Y6T7_9TELE